MLRRLFPRPCSWSQPQPQPQPQPPTLLHELAAVYHPRPVAAVSSLIQAKWRDARTGGGSIFETEHCQSQTHGGWSPKSRQQWMHQLHGREKYELDRSTSQGPCVEVEPSSNAHDQSYTNQGQDAPHGWRHSPVEARGSFVLLQTKACHVTPQKERDRERVRTHTQARKRANDVIDTTAIVQGHKNQ